MWGGGKPLAILIGAEDELFYADRYAPLIHGVRPDVPVTLVAGVNHMGMVTDQWALAAITALMGTGPSVAFAAPPAAGSQR